MPSKQKWVDFKEVKSKVTMEMTLEHYGFLDQLTRKGDKLVGVCPIHKGSNKSQFSVTPSKNIFKCFSGHCGVGGNVLDFVAAMEDTDIRGAAIILAEWFNIEPRKRTQDAQRAGKSQKGSTDQDDKKKPVNGENKAVTGQEKEGEANPPLKFELKTLHSEHSYLKERELSPGTIKHFGIGYCSRGMMAGRIAIPIHNEKGDLVAYAGRLVDDEKISEEDPKYKLPPNFLKSLVVFNLHRAKGLAKDEGLIIVEGFFDVFDLYQEGIENVIAIMGSSLSEAQEKLILEAVGNDGKIEMRFDDDEAGIECAKETFLKLGKKVWVKTK